MSYFSGVKIRAYLTGLVIFVILFFAVNERCLGYIMPAEQLVDFMVANFSKFKTLIVTQSTRQAAEGEQGNETVFREQIWMKSPNLVHFKILDENGERTAIPDLAYRQLLMSNSSERIEQILFWMGINLRSVAFTRIDGVIAYRIGGKDDKSPKLLIGKEGFLPLLLIYRSPDNPTGGHITVRFKDYRKLEKGWYPFEITYSVGDEVRETYTLQTLQANVPVNAALLQPSWTESFQEISPERDRMEIEEEKRLRRIIEAFEEKYR